MASRFVNLFLLLLASNYLFSFFFSPFFSSFYRASRTATFVHRDYKLVNYLATPLCARDYVFTIYY